MRINRTFLVAGKLIFTGSFGDKKNTNPKGEFDLVVDGKVILRVHIEGEVFDNTRETSLWAIAPVGFDVGMINTKDAHLVPTAGVG